MLTIQEIKNAKVGDKPRKLNDRDGLYLFVTPTGGKLWRGKYRVNGREKTLSLGPYPKVGLAEAREKWQDARKLDDPSAAKQAEKQASDSATPTFLAVAKEWHTRQNTFTSGYMERIRFWSTHMARYQSTLQNLTVKMAIAPTTIIDSE